jgi:Na+/H+-dicarboxylate symporter
MVPDNAVAAMSNNSLMLQVIFAIFLGISMLLIAKSGVTIKEFL